MAVIKNKDGSITVGIINKKESKKQNDTQDSNKEQTPKAEKKE